MDTSLRPLFEPFSIKQVVIRNRFVSTSHAPGYAVDGNITQRYIDYEAEKAKGGVGLVQFGGATAVSIENSFHYGQINGATCCRVPSSWPQWRRSRLPPPTAAMLANAYSGVRWACRNIHAAMLDAMRLCKDL